MSTNAQVAIFMGSDSDWPMGGTRNAGLFAVQMLATADDSLNAKFAEFKRRLTDKVVVRNDALQKTLGRVGANS